MPTLPRIARAALHHWEEPPISGTRGAGTVFFSGCALSCLFCQNRGISQDGFGKTITPARLREIFEDLIRQGAHNIDLVSPSHFAPAILEALNTPLSVPVVWNSGGYDSLSTLKTLEGKIQIFLPDLKYLDAKTAKAYSGAADYPAVAKAAIAEMVRQVGPVVLDENGILQRGVLIRHLLLPVGLREAKEVMDWVAGTFPKGSVLFSLMSQYVPYGDAEDLPPLHRPLRESEIKAAVSYMEALDLPGFVQEREAANTGYIPLFDLSGL